MANNCWNWVGFEGDETSLKKLQKDIDEAIEKSDGCLIRFSDYLLDEDNINSKGIDLYDTYGTKWWSINLNSLEGDMLSVGGDSAWSPPSELIKRITKKYSLTAILEFEEISNDFGGTETYINGELVSEKLMTYNEWVYFTNRECALDRIIDDIEDSPSDLFEDLDSIDDELAYMSDEDIKMIKDVYLKAIGS